MKQILVPCDFSKEAVEAYKFSLELAKKADLDVLVLYTIDLPVVVTGFDVVPYTFDVSLQNELKENAIKNFNGMIKKAGNSFRVKFEVKFDSLIRAVQALADAGNIELIVMGTKGSSGLEEVVFGSNTEKVVRFSSVPVFAVRTAPRIESIRRIVLPNHLGLDQTELMKRVLDLQKFFDAQLHLLWVNTPGHFVADSEIHGLMREFAHHYSLSNYSLVIKNDLYEAAGIIKYSEDIDAGIIAMGTSSRRGLAHFFQGSIAEDVVNHVNCPIWTFSTRK
ncbi:MAG TPA: universal stress protein [Cyclobacteriaceae bacterium]|nr:universal stress protein [Cyclobacteriaceae bacterium]